MADVIFRRALARFERAVRSDEMAGAQPPDDYAAITDEYIAARRALVEMVEGVAK